MLSHGIEVLDLDNAECKNMMEDYIRRNPALWDGFLAELNPDLLNPSEPSISIRHHFLSGDVGYITYLHAVLYAPEQGWDHTFDSYVASLWPSLPCAAARRSSYVSWKKRAEVDGVAIVKFSKKRHNYAGCSCTLRCEGGDWAGGW